MISTPRLKLYNVNTQTGGGSVCKHCMDPQPSNGFSCWSPRPPPPSPLQTLTCNPCLSDSDRTESESKFVFARLIATLASLGLLRRKILSIVRSKEISETTERSSRARREIKHLIPRDRCHFDLEAQREIKERPKRDQGETEERSSI